MRLRVVYFLFLDRTKTEQKEHQTESNKNRTVLFPVGFALEADVDIFEIGDALGFEVV